MKKIAIAIAIMLSMTGLFMSALSGLGRGGSVMEQVVFVVCSLAICAAVHLFPALHRQLSPIYGVWALGFFVVLTQHLSFFAATERHAVESRGVVVEHSRNSLAVAEELSKETKRLAKMAYLPDDKKAGQVALISNLSNELDMLKESEKLTKSKTADPLGLRIAIATGYSVDAVMLGIQFATALVLEILAPAMWLLALAKTNEAEKPKPHMYDSPNEILETKTKPKEEPTPRATRKKRTEKPSIEELVEKVKAGEIQPKVTAIRVALACSQEEALKRTREIKLAVAQQPDLLSN